LSPRPPWAPALDLEASIAAGLRDKVEDLHACGQSDAEALRRGPPSSWFFRCPVVPAPEGGGANSNPSAPQSFNEASHEHTVNRLLDNNGLLVFFPKTGQIASKDRWCEISTLWFNYYPDWVVGQTKACILYDVRCGGFPPLLLSTQSPEPPPPRIPGVSLPRTLRGYVRPIQHWAERHLSQRRAGDRGPDRCLVPVPRVGGPLFFQRFRIPPARGQK